MWELDHKEGWASENWCFWIMMLEKTLESPLESKEIKPVNPKGNQSWIFIGRTDAEAPTLWPPDVKSWLIWKDPDAGKDWGQEEKAITEDEMVGWYHRLNGLQFEQSPRVGDGQGSLACCSPWSHKESDTTGWLNWTYIRGIVALQIQLGSENLKIRDREKNKVEYPCPLNWRKWGKPLDHSGMT